MIVPFKDKNYNSAWVFLKPLTWDLWVTSACFFVFIGFLVWILERQLYEDFNGNPLQQVSTCIWFSISTMVFSHSNSLSSSSLLHLHSTNESMYKEHEAIEQLEKL